MALWTVFDAAGKRLAANVDAREAAAAVGSTMGGASARAQPGRIADSAFKLVDMSGALVDDVERARSYALAEVDRQRETARETVMTRSLGQSYVYAQKAGELHDYRNVVGNLLAALTLAQRRLRFPFAMAEADATGDSLATVIARFETGVNASRPTLAAIEAKAVAAKRAIRAGRDTAAVTAASKINWGQ